MSVKLVVVKVLADGNRIELDLDEYLTGTDVTVKIIDPPMHKFSGIHLQPGETFPAGQKFEESIELWYTGAEE